MEKQLEKYGDVKIEEKWGLLNISIKGFSNKMSNLTGVLKIIKGEGRKSKVVGLEVVKGVFRITLKD